MAGSPLVSVVMPVRDGARFLREALDSVLGQSLADLELIVIDDGSSDETPAILSGRAPGEPRLRLVTQSPAGLVAALNRGFGLARGRFVARLDADDIAHRDRLRLQVAFLEAHPEVGVVGSAWAVIDERGRWLDTGRPLRSDAGVRWSGLLTAPFAHPAVTIRREVLERHGLAYDPAWQHVEDYELWTRVLRVSRGANLGTILLAYRRHGAAVSARARALQLQRSDELAWAAIAERVPAVKLTADDVRVLRECLVGGGGEAPGPAARVAAAFLYLDLLEAFLAVTGDSPDAGEVRRHGVTGAALCALRAAPAAGAGKVLARAARADRRAPWYLAVHAERALARQAHRIGRARFTGEATWPA